MFHKTEEPLDADAWIRAIESKFTLLTNPCSEANKARFAVQRLGGISLLWWENHVATLPAGHVVSSCATSCAKSSATSPAARTMGYQTSAAAESG